jgi:hypothetical protein
MEYFRANADGEGQALADKAQFMMSMMEGVTNV